MPDTPLLPVAERPTCDLNGKMSGLARSVKSLDYKAVLDQMRQLKDGWDGYAAPAPTEDAINNSKQICSYLQSANLDPTRVAPSVVGGVGITRRNGERKAYIEVRNDGRVFALMSDGIDPTTCQVDQTEDGLSKLGKSMREYLDA